MDFIMALEEGWKEEREEKKKNKREKGAEGKKRKSPFTEYL